MRETSNNTFRHATRMPGMAVILLLAVVLVSLPAAPAKADTLAQHIATVHEAVGLTAVFALNPFEERDIINTSYKTYLLQQKNKPAPRVGQVSMNGSYPTQFVMTGDSATATFHFVDTTTELPAAGPDVDEVVYEWDTDPTDAISWVFLGSSTDILNSFPLSFTSPGPYPYEPMLRATPYYQGSPVVLLGVDDENIAVGIGAALVPEPASILLMAPGILALWMVRGRRGSRRLP